LRAFLEGAGVPAAPAGADPQASLRAYGQVFRAMTEGLREVVMARTAIKGEMRIEQTMIRSTNNNPLKFSMTPDDAVLAMLSAGRPGYMPALTATKEAVDDIKTHELAVMVGVRSALEGLLRRFNPDSLESRLTQGMLSSVLPAARKARLWDSFRDTYKTIASEAEDDFQAVFGREFAKAYMAQARKE
jgi:type VI secretion system FHA domain protein